MTARAPRGAWAARVRRTFGVGVAAGLVWGVVARGFMRLLTTDPQFTWSGTAFIVGTSALVGGLVMTVRAARIAGRSRWWRLLGLPFVLLFSAAGAVLLPGVVGVVVLLDRRRWLALPGVGLVGLTLWAVVGEVSGPLSMRQWVGVVVLLGCLSVEGWAARELVRRWRPRVRAPHGMARGAGSRRTRRAVVTVDGEARRSATLAP